MSEWFNRLLPHTRFRNWCYRQATAHWIRPFIARRKPFLIAVTGTNGKTTVCRLLERIYQEAGYCSGAATTEGVLREGRWMKQGDYAGGSGIWHLLRRGLCDVVIAETSRGGILRFGLGFQRCDCAVVTNVSDDHVHEDGVKSLDELAAVKRRIVECADVAVLNADDPLVRAMAERVPGRVVYFANEERALAGGDGVFRRGDVIVWKGGGASLPLCTIADIAIAEGGVLAFQVQNVMAALAAVQSLQARRSVEQAAMLRILRTFGRDRRDYQNRGTLLRYRGALVLILQCKNPAGYRACQPVIDAVKASWTCGRVVGLLTDVGRKPDAAYRDIGRQAAALCDEVVVGPPHPQYLRGRQGSELVQLLSADIPAGKLRWNEAASLDDLLRAFEPLERTLFVAFKAPYDSRIDEELLLEHGEKLPLRRS